MTILFDAHRTVNRNPRPFGLGVSRPDRNRLPFRPTPEDAAWAAYELNKDSGDYSVVVTAEDRHFDRMAADSAALDRVERGIRGF